MAKKKLTLRISGYAVTYVVTLAEMFTKNNISELLATCVTLCMKYDNTHENTCLNVWFESPKRHKKKDSSLETYRNDCRFTTATFLDNEQMAYVNNFVDEYPMFRKNFTNVITACVYAAVGLMLRGEASEYNLTHTIKEWDK